MKILVIFTGGTIGSAVSDGWISPTSEMKYLLIEKYRKITGDDMHFDTLTPYTILSENLCAENINFLIKCVGENINNYDGIIVTHGTDTLQYSAAALGFAFGCNCTPVVLVSSNYPINDERANGVDNFIGAVEFIKSAAGRGVFVSYKNGSENIQFHIATRILSHNEYSDEIHSFDRQAYALLDGAKVVLNPDCQYKNTDASLVDIYYEEKSRILVLNVLPDESYNFDPAQYNAIILRPYHSGTLNTSSERFRDFCERAKNVNIPVFVVNVPHGTTYESAKDYDVLNLKILPMCSFPAIYMKIWLGISNHKPLDVFISELVAEEYLQICVNYF